MINIENRKVDKIDAISVMNDNEVIELRFRIKNKLTELLNLTDCNAVWINYQNGTAKDRYNVGTIAVDGDYCEFSWILGKNATKSAGKTYFVICAQRTDGATVLQEWNSILTSFSVEKGLEVLRTDSEPYSDIFAQLTEEIEKKVETIVAGTNIEVEREGGTVTISAQGGGSVFTAEYTVQQDGATCNKTFSEIFNAYQAGAVIRAVANDSAILELAFVSETEIVFRGAETAVQLGIFHASDNSIEIEAVDLQKQLTAGARIQIGTDNVISADVTGLATETALGNEATARQNADNNLQMQIDAIIVSSDVVDIVGTYQELLNYDTTGLYPNSVIKVLQDSTHSNALSYYRWVIVEGAGSWVYVGSEGPFYTKGEADLLLQEKVNISQGPTNANKLVATDSNGDIKTFTDISTLTGRQPLDLKDSATGHAGTRGDPVHLEDISAGFYNIVNGGYICANRNGKNPNTRRRELPTGGFLYVNSGWAFFIDIEGNVYGVDIAGSDYPSWGEAIHIDRKVLSSNLAFYLTKTEASTTYQQKKTSTTINDNSTVTLVNNTEYTGTAITDLTFAFPNENFECYISLTTASSGTIAIDFDSNAKFIGEQPTFSNDEEWEISIKNGVIVAGKVE